MNLSRRTAVVAWAGAGVLVAAVVTGVASAATSPAPPAPAPQGAPAAPAAKPPHGGGGLGNVLHGQYVVQTKTGVKTMHVQRGEITAVDAGSITLKSADGFTGTYAIASDTAVRKDGTTVATSTLKAGDKAGVIALDADGKKTARAVSERTPGVHPARPGKGQRKAPAAGTQSGSFEGVPADGLVEDASLDG